MSVIDPSMKQVAGIHQKKRRKRFFKMKVNRSFGGTLFLFAILAILAAFMVLPLILTISNAFKPLDELFYFPPRFLVRNPTMSNFADLAVLMQATWVPFSRYVVNTLIITAFGTTGHLIIASMAAYPLAKIDFKGKKFLFNLVVLSLMFSAAVTAIPNYMIITALGMNNSYLAIIVPAFAASLGLYLMRQFMTQIPDSLIESARLDGANEFRIYLSVVMPNVKPAWLTVIILMFQSLWGATGGIFLRDEALKPLSFALNQIIGGGFARAGAGAAVMFIMMIVPITFFILAQSRIMETMATSGMKD
ncbi:MAG: carbohydrate ABC transporter permease [Defluviitaleaceae bacterium]|nr:carbohydrate ABC transporter permease [Defluviitaleaceae bacterium]